MIASITKGSGFRGLFEYLLQKSKDFEILSDQGCLSIDINKEFELFASPAKLAAEFELIAAMRPTVTKPVRHFSIGFSEADGNVSNEIKTLVAAKIIKKMGKGKIRKRSERGARRD